MTSELIYLNIGATMTATTQNAQELLAALQAEANAAADVYEDMNESVAGGGSRLLPEGVTLCRLVEVIELGSHAGEFNGKPKPPAPMLRLGFELYSPGYANEDGTPYLMRTFDISRSRNEKAGAFKLFKKLNYKGTAKHFGQLIGEAYLLKIVNKPSKADPAVLRSRIDLEGFLPPFDPLSKQPYPLPALTADNIKMFLWDKPSLSEWNKLYIDGQNDKGESKNWLQNEILSAVDFPGSLLEQLLISNNIAFTIPAKKEKAAAPAAAPAVAAGAALPPSIPAAGAALPPAVAVGNVAVAAVAAPAVAAVAPLGTIAPVVAPVLAAAPNLPQV